MAIVNLKDVKCVGTFSKGFRVVEESKSRDGREFVTRWTVWDDSLGVREGDVVSLSGFLSAKVNEWTDKENNTRHSVELSLNSPRMAENASQQGQGASTGNEWATTAPANPGGSQGDWNTPAFDSETPF